MTMLQQRAQRDYGIGTKVVTASRRTFASDGRRHGFEDYRIETIIEFDDEAVRLGHNARAVLEHEGERREVVIGTGGVPYAHGRQPIWDGDLPGDQELGYIPHIAEGARRPMLFHVAANDDDVCYVHIFSMKGDMHADDRSHFLPMGNAWINSDALRIKGQWSKGDLVVAYHRNCRYDDGVFTHEVIHDKVLRSDITRREAGDYIHRPIGDKRLLSNSTFYSMSEIDREEDIALASTKPDEALILVWMDGDNSTTKILTHTGRTFTVVDDSQEDYLYGQEPGAGLWLFSGAKMWSYQSYEGEHDSGIDGDWTPATKQDVIRLMGDEDALKAEMADHMDIDRFSAEAETLVQDYIAMAIKVDEGQVSGSTAESASVI